MKGLALLLFAISKVVNCLEINTVEDGTVFLTKQNNSADKLDWWQNAVFYQIYPRSFMDSNNDGIGDLKGIIQKLSHLHDMGITAVWLSPIFESPQVDQGYDISDYYNINPDYGTLDDLRELVDRAHYVNIKVILDFVPNHTSDQHLWFQLSAANVSQYFADLYVWKDCVMNDDGTVIPPNNWISHFGGSAWTYHEQRKQCYLHQFAKEQPDLNYNNPAVGLEMHFVLIHWLNFGIDGFRIDAVGTIFEDPEFRDEPLSNAPGVDENSHDYLNHIYTLDQPGTYELIYQWRELLDLYTFTNKSETKVIMTETYTSIEKTMLYYGLGDGSKKGAHFAFNFNFITTLAKGFSIDDLTSCIESWLTHLPSIYTSNWVLGNHDVYRVATRFGTEYIDTFHMLTAFLPGVMVTYNGEEIGMENGEVTCEEGHDPRAIKNCTTFPETSRDFERTPFHWDNSTNAGFNEGATPWLPVSSKFMEVNLAAQNIEGLHSHYKVYKDLVDMKKDFQNIVDFNELTIVPLTNNTIQFIRRNLINFYSLVCNIGGEKESVEIRHTYGDFVVQVASVGGINKVGDYIVQGVLELGPYESVIVYNTVVSGGTRTEQILTYFIVFFVGIITRFV